jgi:hypothetical protein
MNALKMIRVLCLLPVLAQGADAPAQRDGQRDFDWEIGTWSPKSGTDARISWSWA